MKKNNTVKINMGLIIVIILFFVAIIIKLSYVNIAKDVDGIDIEAFANNRNTTKKTLYATRGAIYDTNGDYLAQTVNSYTIIAYLSSSRTTNPDNPKHVVDKENTARKLSEILTLNGKTSMTYEYILSRLNLEGRYQVEFGSGGSGITELLKSEIENLNLPGIDFVTSSKRYYQMDKFASYLVGYARKNDDGKIVGEMGIEKYFNNELSGKDGQTEYQTDSYGYKLPNSNENTTPATAGANIYLTIDNNIQLFLEQEINNLTKENSMAWMTFTIADAKTGAILASASNPSFNPNKLDITNYLNPLVSYAYEPGSTMKIFSFMAAMENGIYDGSKEYMSGKLQIGSDTVNDFNKVGWGKINFDTGFSYSSNTAASLLALDLGNEKLRAFYDLLGFGQKTGITLPDEVTGKIDFQYPIELATASFGQGITTTPIQNIQALTSIANDGMMLKPYIVDKIVDPNTNKVMYQGGREEVRKVASTETIKKIQDMMHNVVYSNLTDAKNYKPAMVEMIGKTGTAQIANPNGRGYLTGSNDYIRSFSGLFPYNDPQYIVYISVKQFSGNFKKVSQAVVNVVDEIVKYKNIVSTVEENKEQSIIVLESYLNTDVLSTEEKLKALGLNPVVIGDGKYVVNQYPNKKSHVLKGSKVFLKTESQNITMPDVTNWSENEITTFCNFIGLKYTLNGSGHVTSISIPAGSVIDLSTIVEINLTK
ncbi:MAG: penicillin-binding protein [Bacilli bacterium]